MVRRTVDSIGVRSLATILGVVGLLWGLIVAVTLAVSAFAGGPAPGLPELVISVVGGGLYGVVVGALTALVYNAAASLAGGVELDVS
jgi:hypothetical protein